MGELEKSGLLPLHDWIITNTDTLITALEYERQRLAVLSLLSSDSVPDYFNRQKRLLSEMPLCLGLREIETPPGFILPPSSSVQLMHQGARIVTNHTFFYEQETGKVLCFTPGQFVAIDNPFLHRGERIAALIQQAAHLVTPIADEIAYMYGMPDEIDKEFGVRYLVNASEL